jgi:hypothetical protein
MSRAIWEGSYYSRSADKRTLNNRSYADQPTVCAAAEAHALTFSGSLSYLV